MSALHVCAKNSTQLHSTEKMWRDESTFCDVFGTNWANHSYKI